MFNSSDDPYNTATMSYTSSKNMVMTCMMSKNPSDDYEGDIGGGGGMITPTPNN